MLAEFTQAIEVVRNPPDRLDKDGLREWKKQLDGYREPGLLPARLPAWVVTRAKWKAERGYGPIDERWNMWQHMYVQLGKWLAEHGLKCDLPSLLKRVKE